MKKPTKKLRKRKKIQQKKKRHKTPPQKKHDKASQPQKLTAGQPGETPRPLQSDEMFGGNVRDEQRCADGEPSHAATGEEVVRGGPLFSRKVQTDGKDDDEVNNDDRNVDGLEALVGTGTRASSHPLFLRYK